MASKAQAPVERPVSSPRPSSGTSVAPRVEDLGASLYRELRHIAARYIRHERHPSVEATDLVHEAYLRLLKHRPRDVQSRAHFRALAAIAMRRLLVERARARQASKRGGSRLQVTLNSGLLVDPSPQGPDLVALDRALGRLAALDPTQARLVELRFFGGLSIEETAEVLALSPATVKRHWTIARAWLKRELSDRA